MEACGGCGFRNGPGRDSCARCGRVFRERRSRDGLRLGLAALVGLAALAAGVATVLHVFDPFATPPPAAPRGSPSAPVAESAPPPAPPPLPEAPGRKKGEGILRQAERLYADGDYPAAAAAYEEARFFLGALEGDAAGRKEAAEWVVQVRDIRDYLARETYLEPPRITHGHLQLSRMDPARLPTDAWRREHRQALSRLEKLVATVDLPGARQVEK